MTSRARSLSWFDRIELRLCTSRNVDGIWIGAFEGDAPALLERVELALVLVWQHDPQRYRAIKRYLSRIWVRLLPGPTAVFVAAANACQLDTRYVGDATVTLEELATSIVHEATHARIDHRVPYREDLRHRIEAVCRRQELAFARRLPGGAAIVRRMEEWLATPPSQEFWSDAAFRDRSLDGSLENLRHLGVPERVLSVLRRFHVFMRGLRKTIRGLITSTTRKQM